MWCWFGESTRSCIAAPPTSCQWLSPAACSFRDPWRSARSGLCSRAEPPRRLSTSTKVRFPSPYLALGFLLHSGPLSISSYSPPPHTLSLSLLSLSLYHSFLFSIHTHPSSLFSRFPLIHFFPTSFLFYDILSPYSSTLISIFPPALLCVHPPPLSLKNLFLLCSLYVL